MTFVPLVAVATENRARDVVSVLSLVGVYGGYKPMKSHYTVVVRIRDMAKADRELSAAIDRGDLTL